jgi:hypothetical protein
LDGRRQRISLRPAARFSSEAACRVFGSGS